MHNATWRYDHLTWVEMKAALARDPQPVVAVPIGAVEDHGPHLPLSTDNDILEGVLAECGRRAAGDLLVLPRARCKGHSLSRRTAPPTHRT